MNKVNPEQIVKLDEIMHTIQKRYKNYQTDIEALFPEGITSTELSIIKIVNSRPEIIIKEVSEYLDLAGSTLTSAIDRLEKRKLMRRVVSTRNRRSFGLELTEEGIRINTLHEAAERQIWSRILGKLENEQERETFLRLLEAISE